MYVRNRKNCQELSEWLQTQGIACDYYHAGLNPSERNARQEAWKSGKTPVIVCTNAFGMGIDKADVRVVIHYDLPDTLEAYFQEAGRAGRDEKTAYAVLLYDPQEDLMKARKRVGDNYPEKEYIEKAYHKICDALEIGAGSGAGHTWAIHPEQLCANMHLPLLPTLSALHLVAQAGYIEFEEDQETKPRVQIIATRSELNHLSLSEEERNLLDELMRNYPGIFTDLQYINVNENENANGKILAGLAARGVVTYIKRTVADRFTLVQDRQIRITIPEAVYEKKRSRFVEGLRQMIEYASETQFCRQQVLLSYFGEHDAAPCGTCDVCRSR